MHHRSEMSIMISIRLCPEHRLACCTLLLIDKSYRLLIQLLVEIDSIHYTGEDKSYKLIIQLFAWFYSIHHTGEDSGASCILRLLYFISMNRWNQDFIFLRGRRTAISIHLQSFESVIFSQTRDWKECWETLHSGVKKQAVLSVCRWSLVNVQVITWLKS